MSGTEYTPTASGAIFLTKYDAEFNDFEFISLSASQEMIAEVDCHNIDDTHGSVNIVFEEAVNRKEVKKMFPLSSLLVVDGSIFGSCDFVNSTSNGYLLVESAYATSQDQVTVKGEISTILDFFSQLSMSYAPDQTSRKLARSSFSESATITEPDDSALTVTTTVGASGSAFIEVAKLDWSFWDKSFEVFVDFGFVLNAELSTTVDFDISDEIQWTKNFPKDPGDWYRVPIYTLAVAQALESILNFFLDDSSVDLSMGLFVALPMNIAIKSEQKFSLKLGGFEAKATTGEKHYRFQVSSESGADLVPVTVKDASIQASSSSIFSGPLDNILDDLDVDVVLSGFVGFKPQVEFKTFSLARGSLGVKTGFFFDANYTSSYPTPHKPIEASGSLPMQFGSCNTCHLMQMNLEAGVAEPFLSYSYYENFLVCERIVKWFEQQLS